MAEAISEMKDVDFKADTPVLDVSSNLDPKIEERENKAYEKIYDKQISNHIDRIAVYKENQKGLYSMILTKYCTDLMQITIKRREDFASSLKNKPIALLKAIRECIHTSSNGEYPYETLTLSLIHI